MMLDQRQSFLSDCDINHPTQPALILKSGGEQPFELLTFSTWKTIRFERWRPELPNVVLFANSNGGSNFEH